ncbi:MAG: alpha/beta hydrolase [Chitinophagaceae bacterium]
MKLAQKIIIEIIRARLNILGVISPKWAAKQAFKLFSTPHFRTKKPDPPIFKKGEVMSFDMDGKKVFGYRWNHPSNKRLLILHGFESSCKNFDSYITNAIKMGYEVYAFDAPAHGKSEGKRIILPIYVQMIRKIEENFGSMNTYLAHSFGGLAITHYLESIPQNPIWKLILIAPATETKTAIDSFFKFVQLNNTIRKEFDQMIFDKSGVWPSHYSIKRAFENIHCKTLWIHDHDDDITPISDVKPIVEIGHPNIDFLFTNGLGHRRIYRDNKVKKAVYQFLEM